jgi:membrane-anchored mycosin MYCP
LRYRGSLSAVAALLTASTSVVAATAIMFASPAFGKPACSSLPPAGRVFAEPPWAQQRFGLERLLPFADGSGVTVAVIDSGVDRGHPQLRGRVRSGADFLDRSGDGLLDCKGHGTGVASLIAAAPRDGVQFRGVAPGARILPVRVSERDNLDRKDPGDAVTPAELGQAIRWAVQHGAKVINLSLVLDRDTSEVRSAIRYAVAKDVVVVAAAGNSGQQNNPRPYPAAYDGVLGVGAIGPDGLRASFSQVGPYVDVVAPGEGVIMAAVGGGYAVDRGTSYAAPFVAATAALVRDYWPTMSAKEVVRRIVATADPAAGGRQSEAYGAGVVNPYRAVTEKVAQEAPERLAPLPVDRDDPAAVALRERAAASRQRALTLAAGGAALAGLAVLLAVVIPRGIRRRWRSAEPA